MMNKKVTRKEFLLSVLSITALLAISKVPNMVKKSVIVKRGDNNYGNYSYGGNKKNA